MSLGPPVTPLASYAASVAPGYAVPGYAVPKFTAARLPPQAPADWLRGAGRVPPPIACGSGKGSVLPTNQAVGSSNLSGRARKNKRSASNSWPFLLRDFCERLSREVQNLVTQSFGRDSSARLLSKEIDRMLGGWVAWGFGILLPVIHRFAHMPLSRIRTAMAKRQNFAKKLSGLAAMETRPRTCERGGDSMSWTRMRIR